MISDFQSLIMLQPNVDTQKKVTEIFGKTEDEISRDVETIKEWMRTQPHLPEIMGDRKIRNFLNLNKFRLEKVKERIDMYYTVRTKIPEFFEGSNPKLANMKRSMETLHFCCHPVLIDGIHRVTFMKPKKPNTIQILDSIRYFFNIFEVRLEDDVMVDDIFVCDLTNVTFRDIAKCSPRIVGRSFIVYKNVFSFRMKELHFINSPFYISLLIHILKFILPPKLFGRVYVHRDEEIVKELFSEDALPKDYGGGGPSLDELNDAILQKFLQHQDRFDQLDRLRVDENLRPKKH